MRENEALELLVRWLAGRTVDRLAALIAARPHFGVLGGPPRTLHGVARNLRMPHVVRDAMAQIDQIELQILAVAAGLGAEEDDGPWSVSDRTIGRDDLVEVFAPEARERVSALVEGMRDRLVFFPGGPGELVVPAAIVDTVGTSFYRPRRLAETVAEAFGKPEIQRLARVHGLPAAGPRDMIEDAVVARITDPVLLRALLADAPEEAVRLVEGIVERVTPVQVDAFAVRNRYEYAGSGDAGVDWLASRGLLVPVGPGLVEAPLEVFEAVAGPLYFGLGEAPAPPPSVAARQGRIVHEAEAALAAADSKVDRLCRALDEAPAALRKSGGLAVRETRRLAREIGADEAETRLWIDLAAAAGLLGVREEGGRGPGQSRLLPTDRYDVWRKGTPADRLLPVVLAWARFPGVITWEDPYVDRAPTALDGPYEPRNVELRRAVLRVLAALPDDRAFDLSDPGIVQEVAFAASFHRPAAFFGEAMDWVFATVAEAGRLGVIAHGALSPLGAAVFALLEGAGEDGMRDALGELLPATVDRAHFQADLSVVVPGPPGFELTSRLAEVADRESDGRAAVWRITPQSVRRALDAGASADELLSRLAEVATGELPQPLTYLITDTARRHGTFKVVRSGCCLRSDDEALLTEISVHTSLRALGLRKIAPTVVISARSAEETLRALRAEGYAPVLEAATGDTVLERVEHVRAPEIVRPSRIDARRLAAELLL